MVVYVQEKKLENSPGFLDPLKIMDSHHQTNDDMVGHGIPEIRELSQIPVPMVDRASSVASSSPTRNVQNVTPFKRHCLKPTYVETRAS